MNFSDIFKSSFMERISTISLFDMLLALALSFVIGSFIMLVYKKTFKGVMYSHGFTVSLLAMTVITTLIILAVTSNVILSLGMVGALSIVRFRSAIKDPLDIAFLFWGISAGIILGAGLIPLAIIGSAVIGIMFLVLMNRNIKDNPYILVVKCDDSEAENRIIKKIAENAKSYSVKTKTIAAKTGAELTIEVRLSDDSYEFVDEISNFNGVSSAVLVSYNGDYMG